MSTFRPFKFLWRATSEINDGLKRINMLGRMEGQIMPHRNQELRDPMFADSLVVCCGYRLSSVSKLLGRRKLAWHGSG